MEKTISEMGWSVSVTARWESVGTTGVAMVFGVAVNVVTAPPPAAQRVLPKQVRILVPVGLRPPGLTAFFGSDVSSGLRAKVLIDSRDGRWQLTEKRGDVWEFVAIAATAPKAGRLDALFETAASAEGSHIVEVVLTSGADHAIAKVPVTVPPRVEGPRYTVTLGLNDESKAKAERMTRGADLTLVWVVKGATRAWLSGPLPDGTFERRLLDIDARHAGVTDAPAWLGTPKRAMAIDDGGSGEVGIFAVGPTRYMLTAEVEPERVPGAKGKAPVLIERHLPIEVAERMFGGTVTLFPSSVFPSGPITCHYSYFNINRFAFINRATSGIPASAQFEPNFKPGGVQKARVANVPERGAFILRKVAESGTEQVEAEVQLGYERISPNPVGTTQIVGPTPLVRDARLHGLAAPALPFEVKEAFESYLPDPDLSGRKVRGLAAGIFSVFTQTGPTTSEYVKRQWVAAATDRGLEVHLRGAEAKTYLLRPEHLRTWGLDTLEAALGGTDFLGVGARRPVAPEGTTAPRSRDEQGMVAVRRTGTKIGVVEVDFPLVLRQRFGRTVKGSEAVPAYRYFDLQTGPDEGAVTLEGSLSWPKFEDATEIQVLSVGDRVYLIGQGVAVSYVWKADRKGVLGRSEPELARLRAGDWQTVVVPGDGDNGWIFAFFKLTGLLLRFAVVNGEVKPAHELARLWGRKVLANDIQAEQSRKDASIAGLAALMRRDNARPDGQERFVALAGAPIVLRRGVHDRAYEPTLDAWVPCGRPFGAWTPGTTFASAGLDHLFARHPDGSLSVQANVGSTHVGFPGHLRPFACDVPGAPSWRTNRLPVGTPFTLGESLFSPNGRYVAFLQGKALVVRDLDKGEDVRSIGGASTAVVARLEKTGELVLWDNVEDEDQPAPKAVWKASEHCGYFPDDARGAVLVLEDDGGLTLGVPGQPDRWHTPRVVRAPLRDQGILVPGDTLESDPGCQIKRRADGALVRAASDGEVEWTTKAGLGPAGLIGGELVVRDAAGKAVWTSTLWGGRKAATACELRLDAPPHFALYEGAKELWHSPRLIGSELAPDGFMVTGDRLKAAGGSVFALKDDGLELRDGTGALKWTESSKWEGARAYVEDGAFVVEPHQGSESKGWRSDGENHGDSGKDYVGAQLKLGDGAYLRVDTADQILWRHPGLVWGSSASFPLMPGETLETTGGTSKFIFGEDGSLSLEKGKEKLWFTEPHKGAHRLRVNTSTGVLEMSDRKGAVLWSSAEHGAVSGAAYAGAKMELVTDGVFRVAKDNNVSWQPCKTHASHLEGKMYRGDSLTSGDTCWTLGFKMDGALVLTGPGGRTAWRLAGIPGAHCLGVGTDGKLRITTPDGKELWVAPEFGDAGKGTAGRLQIVSGGRLKAVGPSGARWVARLRPRYPIRLFQSNHWTPVQKTLPQLEAYARELTSTGLASITVWGNGFKGHVSTIHAYYRALEGDNAGGRTGDGDGATLSLEPGEDVWIVKGDWAWELWWIRFDTGSKHAEAGNLAWTKTNPFDLRANVVGIADMYADQNGLQFLTLAVELDYEVERAPRAGGPAGTDFDDFDHQFECPGLITGIREVRLCTTAWDGTSIAGLEVTYVLAGRTEPFTPPRRGTGIGTETVITLAEGEVITTVNVWADKYVRGVEITTKGGTRTKPVMVGNNQGTLTTITDLAWFAGRAWGVVDSLTVKRWKTIA